MGTRRSRRWIASRTALIPIWELESSIRDSREVGRLVRRKRIRRMAAARPKIRQSGISAVWIGSLAPIKKMY